MSAGLTKWQTPEEQELSRKLSELDTLEASLAQRELDLATLQAELHAFERRYLRTVGARYAELDEIEAQIAETLAHLNPKDNKAYEQASQARSRAHESSQAAGAVDTSAVIEFRPSDSLKKLYREIAKRIHPDLATDEKDRARRHKLMAEANRAYEDGDEARLQGILREWELSPESVKGDGPGAELVRVIRKIAQVEQRLQVIDAEIAKLKRSDLSQLISEVEKAEKEGHDLLAEMAARLDQQITDAGNRLTAATKRHNL